MLLQRHFWNLPQTCSCKSQSFKAAPAMQAMQAALALPCCPSCGCWSYQCSREAGQSGADWARRHILAMRGDKCSVLVSAADLQSMDRGTGVSSGAWGVVAPQHSRLCGHSWETATWGSYIPTCPGVSLSTCRAWAGSGDTREACRKWDHTQQRRWGGMSPPHYHGPEQGLGVLRLHCSSRRWTPSAPVSLHKDQGSVPRALPSPLLTA